MADQTIRTGKESAGKRNFLSCCGSFATAAESSLAAFSEPGQTALKWANFDGEASFDIPLAALRQVEACAASSL
jgi:hypothetical protein